MKGQTEILIIVAGIATVLSSLWVSQAGQIFILGNHNVTINRTLCFPDGTCANTTLNATFNSYNVTAPATTTLPAANITKGTFPAGNFSFTDWVGIGTTSPSSPLDIKGGITALTVNGSTYSIVIPAGSGSINMFNANANIIMRNTNGINWGDGNTGIYGTSQSASQNFTRFVVQSSEIARITSTGLGVGTTSPINALDVVGNINATGNLTARGFVIFQVGTGANILASSPVQILNGQVAQSIKANGIQLAGTYSGTPALGEILSGYGSGITINNWGNASGITFKVNGTTAEYIQNMTGYVGLNQTSPYTYLNIRGEETSNYGQLAVQGGSSNNVLISLLNSTGSRMAYIRETGNDLVISNDQAGNLRFLNNAQSEKMRIDSNGNVGIGTTTPQALLEVEGGCIRINNTNIADICAGVAGSFDRVDWKAIRPNLGISFQLNPNGNNTMSKVTLANNASSTSFGSMFLGVNANTAFLAQQTVGGSNLTVDNLVIGATGGGGLGGSNWNNMSVYATNLSIYGNLSVIGNGNTYLSGNVSIGIAGSTDTLSIQTQGGNYTGITVNQGLGNSLSGSQIMLQVQSTTQRTGGLRYNTGSGTQAIGRALDLVLWNNYNSTTSGNGGISFATNMTEKMYLTGSGYLGIGVTSPTYQLQVANNASISSFLYVNSTNVGIGTTTPNYTLDVAGQVGIRGHLEFVNTSGYVPTLGSCGTSPSLGVNSTDMIGKITVGGGATSCMLIFGKAWTNPPFCIVDDETNAAIRVTSIELRNQTTFSDGGSIAGDTLHYLCIGGT